MNATSKNKKALIVEDEILIRLLLEEFLEDLSVEVVGSFGELEPATTFVENNEIDFALLDYNINGKTCESLANILKARCVPCAILSGDGLVSEKVYSSYYLAKPYDFEKVSKCVEILTR